MPPWCTFGAHAVHREFPRMGQSRQRRQARRRRVGQVSYYPHHGSWWLYYRERGRIVRRRVANDELVAAQVAAQVNAQLAASAPTMFSFVPLPIDRTAATISRLSRTGRAIVAGNGQSLPV